MMFSDQESNEVAFGNIDRAFQKPSECRAQLVTETMALALTALVGRFRPKLASASGIAVAKHFLKLFVSFSDVVPQRGGAERSCECGIDREHGSECGGLSDDKLRVLGDGLP